MFVDTGDIYQNERRQECDTKHNQQEGESVTKNFQFYKECEEQIQLRFDPIAELLG
jgi:hypothetical protein